MRVDTEPAANFEIHIMKRLPLIGEERGAALLGALVICILVMSVLVWSLQWSLSAGKSDSHLADTQRALSYADSGINAAAQRLKMPWLNSDSISSFTVSSSLNNGRYEYTVVVDSETHSLADTYATGYFYLGTGDWTDPLNGQKAQRAVVHAKIYFAGIQNLAAAVPGYLPIGGGTVVDGTLYGNDLIFKRSADGTPSRIGTALYHQSAKREDQEADPAPDYVVFNSSPTAAQHVDYPLHFPRLGLAVRRYYSDRAKASFARLNNGASLDGLVSKPGDSPDAVYFCDGDLNLGHVSAFSAQDSFLIYATGAVYIHKPVLLTVGSWVAILAEQ